MSSASTEGWRAFGQRWLVSTLAVVVATRLVHGIWADSFLSLVAASLLLGVLNAVLRPVLMLLALPLLVMTLGLFLPVINALVLYLVSGLVAGFHVADFWTAVKGALVISIVSVLANMILGKPRARVQVNRPPPSVPPPQPPPDTGTGPVIDI